MKNKQFLLSILILFICTCCCQGPKKDINGYTEYIIEKGSHFSNNLITKQVNTKEFKFLARFDSSAIYHTLDSANQADINKLYGFTEDNLTNDHYNSARIGWRWYNNRLQLLAYCYNKGILENETLIKIVQIGKDVQCTIKLETTSIYIFSVDDATVSIPRKSTNSHFNGNKLYPYFGGTETAPHKIKILIKEI